jgi:hypothetical protein
MVPDPSGVDRELYEWELFIKKMLVSTSGWNAPEMIFHCNAKKWKIGQLDDMHCPH